MSIYGWRWWDINRDGSLRSVNNIIWPPNETFEAECLYDGINHPYGQTLPAYDCTCGVWAFHDAEIAAGLPGVGFFRTAKVFGVIEAWGGIIHHQRGFRAEYADIRGLCVLRGVLHPCYEVPRYRNVKELCAVWDVEPLEPPQ